jgi:hypothetical protein
VLPRKSRRDAADRDLAVRSEPEAIAKAQGSTADTQPKLQPAFLIRIRDEAGNVLETHEHAGEFKEP